MKQLMSRMRVLNCAALRSNRATCSRDLPESLPFTRRLVDHRARSVRPFVKGFATDNKDVDGNLQRSQDIAEPHHLIAARGDLRLNHKQVQVTVAMRITARPRAEHDHLRAGRRRETALDGR